MKALTWCGLILMLAGTVATAQTYPAKPVRLVVPYAPGGSSDTIGRLISEKLRASMGAPVVVDNRPGAGSMIGTDIVSKSTPDGYTLVLSDTPHTINPSIHAKMPYDPIRDFAPITLVGVSPLFLFVATAAPERTLKDLLASAKAAPGKISIGSGGNGSTPHLMIGMVNAAAGVQLSHVPYKGSGPAVADVAGGQIKGVFSTVATAGSLLNANRIRALAVSSQSRNSLLPDVPTFAEAGVPGIVVEQWWGIMAPAGVPRAIVQKLNAEITKALSLPDVRERFASLAVEPRTSTPGQLRAVLEADVKRYAKAAKDAGITAN